jgi:hypothetical protein
MRTYVLISGAIFAVLVIAHVVRLYFEGVSVALEPAFVISTIFGVVMSVWAWYLLKHHGKGESDHS